MAKCSQCHQQVNMVESGGKAIVVDSKGSEKCPGTPDGKYGHDYPGPTRLTAMFQVAK